MNSYLLEQRIATIDDNLKYESNSDAKKSPKFEAKALVCEPSSHNTTAVFNILQTFIREIEEALGCAPGMHCTLSVFVMDYVKDVFLAQLHIDNANRLEQATKALDQWKTCKDVHLLKNLKVSKPILQVGERNRKEAEILNGNLGDQQIPEHEILGDPQQLRRLAHLQESLEWFCGCILRFAVSLPLKSRGVVGSGGIPPVSDASAKTLTSLAKDFEDLSQTCLFVLHLEVFYDFISKLLIVIKIYCKYNSIYKNRIAFKISFIFVSILNSFLTLF